uniref:Ovule protein n=1 Tax=Steinernema glaseri TaxID=37863 RepID=A0A1I7YTM6_9BILA
MVLLEGPWFTSTMTYAGRAVPVREVHGRINMQCSDVKIRKSKGPPSFGYLIKPLDQLTFIWMLYGICSTRSQQLLR